MTLKWLDDWRARRAARRTALIAKLVEDEARYEAAEEAERIAKEKAWQEAKTEQLARVSGEVEKAIAEGKRFLALVRRNEHWQDAVIMCANENQRVLSVHFYTYYKQEYGNPQKALLTLASTQP